MFIKLTDINSGNPIYVNTNAISSVFITDHKEQGNAARVYITGDELPWYVQESVDEVMDRLREQGEYE